MRCQLVAHGTDREWYNEPKGKKVEMSGCFQMLTVACAAVLAGCSSMKVATLPDEIVCEGSYGGHLQGVATDGESIYWAFTVQVVRTDLTGKVLAEVDAPSHEGDLCVKDGVVYVAVNRGRFNFPDRGIGEVRAYDAKTLALKKVYPIPDTLYGAGGMTWRGDRFYVIGGLPLTEERNWVFEYDTDFNLVKRHSLETGFTLMGIQTAYAAQDGNFYFGIYGVAGNPPGVVRSDDTFANWSRHLGAGNVGILELDGSFWTGHIVKSTATGPRRNRGKIVREKTFPNVEYKPARTEKGRLYVFENDSKGWTDSGYRPGPDGYKPLVSNKSGVFVPCKAPLPEIQKAVVVGGKYSQQMLDLVRGVRRLAEMDESLAIRFESGTDPAMRAAVLDEAARLGVQVIRR